VAPIVATGRELAFLSNDETAPITGTVARDAAALARLKTIARWVTRDPFMLFRPNNWTRVASELVASVYDYFNVVFLFDGNAVFLGSRELESRAADLIRLVTAIGDIDAALSVARWRAGQTTWSRPQFLPQGSPAALRKAVHPLLSSPVANSIHLEPGRGILITGSNMSGKSTFLRTVGVTAVLAQTMNTCPAEAYSAPILEIESCIGRSDDLIAGKSYYLVEVDNAVARLRASGEPSQHLFLFDELFRGTNAVERIAAAEAILRELLLSGGRATTHFAVVATHDGELVSLLSDVYAPYHLADTLGADGLQFEYRLEPGPATTRNAIALLRQRGAPDSVIESALRRVAALERVGPSSLVPGS
jgi:DNA mismatch repair ATPase MutS